MTDQAATQSAGEVATGPLDTIDAVAQRLMARQEAPETDKPNDEPKQPEAERPKEQPEDEGEPDDKGKPDDKAEPEVPKYKVPKLDGEGDEELTREELRARMLMQSDYTKKTQAVAEERKAAETLRNQMAQKASEIDQSIQALKQMALVDLQGVDVQALRQNNPQEFVRLMERQSRIAQAIEQGEAQKQAVLKESTTRNITENERLVAETIPEWHDPQVRSREAVELRQFLIAQKFPEEAINRLGEFEGDYRLVKMARDAMLYQKSLAKAQEIKPKVDKAPAPVKPSTPRNVSDDKQSALRNQIRKSGRLEDVAALLAERANNRR